MATIPLIYSGFHDRPLAFVLWYGGAQYLFWREFDEELDDYPRSYDVYRLPEMPDDAGMPSIEVFNKNEAQYLAHWHARVSNLNLSPQP